MTPDWRTTYRLGELLHHVQRPEPVEESARYELLGVRWYAAGCHMHTEAEGGTLKTPVLNRVRAGDVTYNKMWTSKNAFAVVDDGLDGCHASTEYPLFEIVRRDVLDADYLRHLFKKGDLAEQAGALRRGSTSRARLNPADFLRLAVTVPPLPDQRKIADILGSVDEAIQATQAVIDQTRKVKQGLLQQLLARGIGHTRYKQTSIGVLPETWDTLHLQEISTVITNGFVGTASPHYAENGVPYLMAKNVRENRIDYRSLTYITQAFHEANRRSMLEAGDLLTVQSGHIGTSCAVPQDLDSANCHALIISKLDRRRANAEFLALYLNSEQGRGRLADLIVGSTVQHINTKDLKKFLVPVPSLEEQIKIAGEAESVEGMAIGNERHLAALLSLKSKLSEALMSGRARVQVPA